MECFGWKENAHTGAEGSPLNLSLSQSQCCLSFSLCLLWLSVCLLSLSPSRWPETCKGPFPLAFFGFTAAFMISYQLRFKALLEEIYNNHGCVTRASCMIVLRNSIRGAHNWLYNTILSLSACLSSGGLTQSHCYYITDHYCCSGRNYCNFYLNEHRCW